MPKFFVTTNQIEGNTIIIQNEDVNHIKNVLRAKIDDTIDICDCNTSKNYICKIEQIEEKNIYCHIIEEIESNVEPEIQVSVLQGLPKADKMDLIIQKCVELIQNARVIYLFGIGASFWDGIFQGFGYTVVLLIMCIIREFLGAGTILGGLLEISEDGGLAFGLGTAAGIRILPEQFPMGMLTLPVGGFLILACLIAAMQWALSKSKDKEESK